MNKVFYLTITFLLVSIFCSTSFVFAADEALTRNNLLQTIINLLVKGGKAELVDSTSGVCGSANGTTFSSAPTSNLCSSGIASAVGFGGSAYGWYCQGSNGGTRAYCHASYVSMGSLSLVSPSGGEEWKIGKTYTVTWDYTNLKGDINVLISNNKTYSCEQGGASVESKQLSFTLEKHCKYATTNTYVDKNIEPGPHSIILYGQDLNGKSVNYSMEFGKTINISEEVVSVPIDGACGSSNGATMSSTPTTNLCSSGVASGVSGSGPWTWNCVGNNGGTTMTCSASAADSFIKILTPKAGETLRQGSVYTMTYSSAGYSPTTGFSVYLSGNSNLYRLLGTIYPSKNSFNFTVPSDVSGSGFQLDIPGESITNVFSIGSVISVPVGGVCGSSNGVTMSSTPTTNLCSAGIASRVSGSGPWTWNCTGSNGGTIVSCNASQSTFNTQKVCTQEYSPVCGTNGKTYTNECIAKSAGISKAYIGECKETTATSTIVFPTPEKPLNQMNRDELMVFLIKLIQVLFSSSATITTTTDPISNPKAISTVTSNTEEYCKYTTMGQVVEESGQKYCVVTQKVLEQGCGGTYGEGGQNCPRSGKGYKTLLLPSVFGTVTLTSIQFDDSGSISINDNNVYTSGSGCARNVKDLNKEITSYVHAGENNIIALVNNDCGLSMSASVQIKYDIIQKSN